ncbi:hypothetical protein C817_04762 [Dorea sp. 5-2]|nr:hypothetical protein C817_04762 [Dorea sp. 5-2]
MWIDAFEEIPEGIRRRWCEIVRYSECGADCKSIGVAIPPKQSGKTQYRFEINKKALAEWIGISVEEVDRRVAGK